MPKSYPTVPSSMAKGGCKTRKQWLRVIPGHRVSGNPLILYWPDTCRPPDDLGEARIVLEKALQRFREQGEAEAAYLTWSSIVGTYFIEEDLRPLDKWLAELDSLRQQYPEFPTRAIEIRVAVGRLASLVLRQTAIAAIRNGAEEILASLEKADIGSRMAVSLFLTAYHVLTGNYPHYARLVKELQREIVPEQSSPFIALHLRLLEAMHYWLTLQCDLCREAVSAGLEIAERSGIHVFDYLLMACRAESAMIGGDRKQIAVALADLCQKRLKPFDQIHYYQLSAWQALQEGEIDDAYGCMTDCEKQVAVMDSPYHKSLWRIGMAQILFAKSDLSQVKRHLDGAFVLGRKIKSLICMYVSLLYYARCLFAEGNNDEGVAYLHQALLVGRQQGYMHFPWWQPEVMADLCVKALENDIEVDYVRELVRVRRLIPAKPPLHIETWPWPLKIRTLGSFEISCYDTPVVFTGKAPKKPLELLKALASLGGQDVPAARLAAALWPDVEGDFAQHSLENTLYRLRKLLAVDAALQLQAGRLSLDPRHCWIDTEAFEKLCNRIEKAAHKEKAGPAEKELLPLIGKALDLYKGHFLPTDGDLTWTTQTRERLQTRFRRIILIAGEYWEKEGRWEKATAWYQRGVEIDWQAEEFYRRLMLCYQKQGRTAEAVMLYRQLRTKLSRRLDLVPSPKTNAIYRNIVKKEIT